MSNLLLPNLRQPRALSWGWPIRKTPSFSTLIQTPASRRGEVRVSLTPVPVWDFEIDLTYIYGDLNQTNTAIQQFLDFYQRMHGAADDWLFYDPYDNNNAANPSLLGYGDSVTTQFQIGRSLAGAGFEPLQNVIPSVVKIAGVTIPAGPQPSCNQWFCGIENWLAYSQDFSQSDFWSLTQFTDAHASIVAPDGTVSADALTNTGGGAGTNVIIQNFPVPLFSPGDKVTFSVWLKVPSATLGPISIYIINGSTNPQSSITVTTSWQRFSVSTVVLQGSPVTFVQIGTGGMAFPAGQVLHIWGAQLERWASASSYVATTNNAPVFPRGLLTFAIPPASPTAITVGGDYYYRCHFLDDELNDLEQFLWQLWECKSLKFRSLIL